MTLRSLRKHKIVLVVMSIAILAVAIFVATISNAGYAEGQVCDSCGQGYITIKYTTAANCGVAGAEVYECLNCYEEFRNTIPATGQHSYKYDSTKQPDGSTHAMKCEVCGGSSSASHNVIACTGKCSICGYQVTTTLASHNYVYDGTKTENSHGIKCTVCGRETTQSHALSEATCILPATCKICEYTSGTVLGCTPGDEYQSMGNDKHAPICTVCGEVVESELVSCSPGSEASLSERWEVISPLLPLRGLRFYCLGIRGRM